MAIVLTGTKTVTTSVAPHLSASLLTSLLATPVEALTIAQFKMLADAFARIPSGHEPTKTIGSLLV